MHCDHQDDFRIKMGSVGAVLINVKKPVVLSINPFAQAAVYAVRFFFRLKYFHNHPMPLSLDTLLENPYKVKLVRKLIDGCAFGMYSHWVKRGENQNRAAMFEHTLRNDWKQAADADGGGPGSEVKVFD